MPLAGQEVSIELERVCTEKTCEKLIDYMNRLYLFKVQYSIYKDELGDK